MKFEELLMQQKEKIKESDMKMKKKKKGIKDVEEEIKILEQDLQGEFQLKSALQCALQGPSVHSCPCVSSLLLPNKIQKLLTEVAMVEEEVICLERKVYGLKLNLHQEQKLTKQKEMMYQLKQVQIPQLEKKAHQKRQSFFKQKTETDSGQHRKHRFFRGRRSSASSGSSTEFCNLSLIGSYEETAKVPRHSTSNGKDMDFEIEINSGKSNKLSEELLTCLIGIYIKLNQKSSETKAESSSSAPKHTSSSSKSKKIISKTSFKCTTLPILSLDKNSLCVDAFENSTDLDGTIRDIGPYKDYLQITQSSIHKRHLSQCIPSLKKLRDLLDELCNVDPTYLTYKQKLAFWINIFNASTMHAFLRLGFPSAQDKLLEVMNETAINIGGIVLNALAIEHFILGHPSESQWGMPEEKEMLLRRSYGLEYPEPNVMFALCRGSWSSPALRIYKPEEVVNQLEKAKIEYLEDSILVTSKKKIMLPKLMQWHMRDFADDMELLIEWIYSQLPPTAALKGLIMECLSVEKKCPTTKMIEILPYNFEFRYILFLQSETKKVLQEQQSIRNKTTI